nr:MAG TPA: hypothetical protein [Caudoviricetes sp.]DAX74614.1 MAG TPA: hypothetical protein [Caudoviricetes sp.]
MDLLDIIFLIICGFWLSGLAWACIVSFRGNRKK